MPCSSSVCILYRLQPLTPPSCPEHAHYLTSALHHCLDFFITLSCSYVPHVDRIHDLHLSTYLPFPFLTAILPFLFISFSSSCVCACLSPSILSDTVLALQPNPISSLTYIVPYSCVLCPIPAEQQLPPTLLVPTTSTHHQTLENTLDPTILVTTYSSPFPLHSPHHSPTSDPLTPTPTSCQNDRIFCFFLLHLPHAHIH
jgi:hypothetical protein